MKKWKNSAYITTSGRRLLAAALCLCMVLSLLPVQALAEDGGAEDTSRSCTCETACTAEAVNADCPVCGAEGADYGSLCTGKKQESVSDPVPATPEPGAVNCAHGHDPESCKACASEARVASVQKLINALPEEVTAETREAAQSALSAVDTAKSALTEAEQGQLDMTRYTALTEKLAEPEAQIKKCDHGNDPGTCSLCAVQTLINALPVADSITEENADAAGAQLTAIDEAMAGFGFGDAEKEQLDLSAYNAAIHKLMELAGTPNADVPVTTMQIFVKTPEGEHITLEVEPTEKIEAVKAKIQDKEGIPADQIILTYNGNPLEDGKVLEYYGSLRDCTLQLSLKETGDGIIDITQGSVVIDDTGYTVGDTVYTYSGDITINGNSTATGNTITVNSSRTITLNNVIIGTNEASTGGKTPLTIAKDVEVDLTVEGTVTLGAGWDGYGTDNIVLGENAKLTIQGNGTLKCGENLSYSKLTMGSGASVTVKSGTVDLRTSSNLQTVVGSGTFTVAGGYVKLRCDSGSIFRDNVTVVLNSGTTEIYDHGTSLGGASLTINGGTLKSSLDRFTLTTAFTLNGGIIELLTTIPDDVKSTSTLTKGIVYEGSKVTVYGDVTLSEDFTLYTTQELTVPNGASLTVGEGTTFTNKGTIINNGAILNNGAIYVDGTLNTTVSGDVYYPLTVSGATVTGTVKKDGKTYAKQGDTITLSPEGGLNPLGWETSDNTVSITDNTFTMPASALTVTAQYGAASVTIGEQITCYLSFTDAFAAANNANGSTLTLMENVSGAGNLFVTGKFTLDLNGKSLQGEVIEVGSVESQLGSGFEMTTIATPAYLTITDSSTDLNGSLNGNINSVVLKAGELNLQQGNLHGRVYTYDTGVLNISGGTITDDVTAVEHSGPVNMSGGSLTANNGIWGSGNVTITGGTITATGSSTVASRYCVYVGSNGTAEIKGGTFTSSKTMFDRAKLTISGGNFPNGISVESGTLRDLLADNCKYYRVEGDNKTLVSLSSDTKSLSGHITVETHICVKTYTNENNGTHSWVCSECGDTATQEEHIFTDGTCICGAQAAACVTSGEQTYYYLNFAEAFTKANATNGSILTLLADVTESGTLTVTAKFTLDLNSKKVSPAIDVGTDSVGAELTVQGVGEVSGAVSVKANSTLTWKNGTLRKGLKNSGNFNLEGGELCDGLTNYGTVNISGGKIKQPETVVSYLVWNQPNPDVAGAPKAVLNISGGELVAYNGCISNRNWMGLPGTVSITGGTFHWGDSSVFYGDDPKNIVISGGIFKNGLSSGMPYLYELLAEDYACYDEQSRPISFTKLRSTKLTGTITVKECTHDYSGFLPNPSDPSTHLSACLYCGKTTGQPQPHDVTGGECACGVVKASYLRANGTVAEALALPVSDFGIKLTTGWYVVDQDYQGNNHIWIDGDVNLILTDKKFALNELYLKSGSLTIWGQSTGAKVDVSSIHGSGSFMLNSGYVNAAAADYEMSNIDLSTITLNGGAMLAGSRMGMGAFNQKPNLSSTVHWKVSTGSSLDSLTPVEHGTLTDSTFTRSSYVKIEPCVEHDGDTSSATCKWCGADKPVRLALDDNPAFDGLSEVWIDGVAYPIETENGRHVVLPDNGDLLTIYNYKQGSAHEKYPTGMVVYRISRAETGAVVEKIDELDNLLQYSGCSIRVTGKRGIRMITSLTKEAKEALKKGQLAGYTLEEYGTVVQWADALGAQSLTLDTGNHNYAYKKGVSDPVFANVGSLTQYTNVLVWDSLTNEQLGQDIVMRPYIVLSKDGEMVTLYGGTVRRSIGYIAYQNRAVFNPGTAAYKYVWDIIHAVYGTQYDSDYKG